MAAKPASVLLSERDVSLYAVAAFAMMDIGHATA
jgi:hypothetical protein